jgi:hypothetical protein
MVVAVGGQRGLDGMLIGLTVVLVITSGAAGPRAPLPARYLPIRWRKACPELTAQAQVALELPSQRARRPGR